VACRGYNFETVAHVMAEKKQLLVESEALSYMDSAFQMDRVGGLSRFKKWLAGLKVAFSEYGRQYGLTPPRGVLLAGIPGTGKSLAAKAAASTLGLPLIKMDISRIFRSYVGESETVCARTMQLLTSLAPCVCLIDELDKVFTSAASTDSGTTQRVLGQILHYMQEEGEGVFFIATCNHVERLPPELIRKGRFADEIFFVDLPTLMEREEILKIHVERYLSAIGHAPLTLSLYAGMMEGFTGAEIEHVVKKALILALNERRPAEPGDLTRAIDAEIPQSRSMAESISEMRELVSEGRYLSAS
jgi:SpoVK/Ycf46/Vps4 family AAA+-type ATPase